MNGSNNMSIQERIDHTYMMLRELSLYANETENTSIKKKVLRYHLLLKQFATERNISALLRLYEIVEEYCHNIEEDLTTKKPNL